MKHNFRPVQPLNNRTVYQVDTSAAPAAFVGTKATVVLAAMTLAFSRTVG
jgi:hypothetical protein